jgi:hypothetical protein
MRVRRVNGLHRLRPRLLAAAAAEPAVRLQHQPLHSAVRRTRPRNHVQMRGARVRRSRAAATRGSQRADLKEHAAARAESRLGAGRAQCHHLVRTPGRHMTTPN